MCRHPLHSKAVCACRVLAFALAATPPALLAVAPEAGSPKSLSLEIDVVDGAAGSKPVSLTLCVTPRDSSEATSRILELEAPWIGELEIPFPLPWRVAIQSPDGYWAAEHHVNSEDELNSPLVLQLLPAGFLEARLISPGHDDLPENAKLQLRPSPSPSPEGETASFLELRPLGLIEGGTWRIQVPAGHFDVRLAVGDFVPVYAWNVDVAPGETTDLGLLRLEKGASVAGWVAVVGGGSEVEAGVGVELVPRSFGNPPRGAEARRVELRAHRTQANERGFFQISGVSPGGYGVRAHREGFVLTEEIALEIRDAVETTLADPLVLEPLAELELYLDPPLDLRGEPWNVELLREEADCLVLQEVAEGTVSSAGFWHRAGLEAGSYRVAVRDSRQAVWFEGHRRLAHGDGPWIVELDVVPIQGRVRLGEEPLEATVVFGTTQGRPSLHFETDEEGFFEGALPREGEWAIEVLPAHDADRIQAAESVSVEHESGQRAAYVDVELPDTAVRGIVRERAQPVEGAGVLAIRHEARLKRREAMIATDEDGHFELRGLSPGTIALRAKHLGKSSDWVVVEIVEDLEAPEISLDLEERFEVAGQVISAAGQTVAGAHVIFLPAATPPDLASPEKVVTQADGSFSLELSERFAQADLIVAAPGWPMHLGRYVFDPVNPRPLAITLAPHGGDLITEETRFNPAGDNVVLPLVLHHDGAELDIRWILRFIDPRKIESSEATLVFRGLESGDYSLCRRGGSCAAGYLAPATELNLSPGD